MKDKENLNLNQNFRLSVEKYKKEDFTNLTSHVIAKRDEKLRGEKLKHDFIKQEIDLKSSICVWVMRIVSVYLFFIAYILLLLVLNEGKLESSVVITLLTTTTINILGLPYLIIKSLFPEKKN
jgi:hypothetical protein